MDPETDFGQITMWKALLGRSPKEEIQTFEHIGGFKVIKRVSDLIIIKRDDLDEQKWGASSSRKFLVRGPRHS